MVMSKMIRLAGAGATLSKQNSGNQAMKLRTEKRKPSHTLAHLEMDKVSASTGDAVRTVAGASATSCTENKAKSVSGGAGTVLISILLLVLPNMSSLRCRVPETCHMIYDTHYRA